MAADREQLLRRRASQDGILPKGCVCGHDHQTHRGESVDLCLDCSCDDRIPRCQNCGAESTTASLSARFDVCSRRCALQLEYAETKKVAA